MSHHYSTTAYRIVTLNRSIPHHRWSVHTSPHPTLSTTRYQIITTQHTKSEQTIQHLQNSTKGQITLHLNTLITTSNITPQTYHNTPDQFTPHQKIHSKFASHHKKPHPNKFPPLQSSYIQSLRQTTPYAIFTITTEHFTHQHVIRPLHTVFLHSTLTLHTNTLNICTP